VLGTFLACVREGPFFRGTCFSSPGTFPCRVFFPSRREAAAPPSTVSQYSLTVFLGNLVPLWGYWDTCTNPRPLSFFSCGGFVPEMIRVQTVPDYSAPFSGTLIRALLKTAVLAFSDAVASVRSRVSWLLVSATYVALGVDHLFRGPSSFSPFY